MTFDVETSRRDVSTFGFRYFVFLGFVRYHRRMHFADALTAATRNSSPVCVGLDPMMDKLPEGVPKTIEGMKQFLFGILEAVEGIAPVVKEKGAILVYSKEELNIKCLPKDLVHDIEVDVSSLSNLCR